MKLGCNDDPRWRSGLGGLHQLGANLVRFPLREGRNYKLHVKQLQKIGIEPVLILTNEFFTDREQRMQDWKAGARRAIRAYPTVRYWQIGNEPDIEGPSSETRPAAEYSELLRQCREGIGYGSGLTLLAAGAASGDPSYWDDVDLSPASMFGLHMATQTPATMPHRIAAYERFGLPIAVTEFYAEHGAYPDEHTRAVDMSDMVVAMQDMGVEMALFYAFSDRQFDGGLVDGHGTPNESFAALANAS